MVKKPFKKIWIIGLDCLEPSLAFEQYAGEMPHLTYLRRKGFWGLLRSTDPPITVPAWMCMMTGRDPGELGIYGFRNRRNYSYDGLSLAHSRMVPFPKVWDYAGQRGRQVVILGVPLTYPPQPVNGVLVTDFLTPSKEGEYTYPPALKAEVEKVVGDYLFDVREFRTENKEELLEQIYQMTEKRFCLARYLLQTRSPDFFIMVEMGPDRLHHGFWKFIDPKHPKHPSANPYQKAVRDYYHYLDQQIGHLLSLAEEDTLFIVVSDHGAQRMEGGICFNDWLIQEGYLTLKTSLQGVTRFHPSLVDWSRTLAWGDGGYYGRLFLNLRGREPEGVIPPQDYEKVRSEIAEKLLAMTDEEGRPLGNQVLRPEEIYSECRNVPPDLIVYFGNLYWRSIGSVGNSALWTRENDTGPDDANHSLYGLLVMSHPSFQETALGHISLYDIAPTLLTAMGLEVPPGLKGRSLF